MDGTNLISIETYTFDGLELLEHLNLSATNIESVEENAFVKLKKLKSLHMRSTRLSRLENRSLFGLESLQILDFADSTKETIQPFTFSSLRKLKQLRLSNNRRYKSIQNDTFSGLYGLQELFLDDCHLEWIDVNGFLGLKYLSYLYLSGSKVRSYSFEHLSQLKYVHVEKNLAEIDHILMLPVSLTQLHLSHSHLNANNYFNFTHLKNLETVKLDNSSSSSSRVQLYRLSTLSLDLSLNSDIEEIDEQLFAGFTSLQKLDLSDSNIGFIHENSFRDLVQLRVLRLDGNRRLRMLNDLYFRTLKRVDTFSISRTSLNFIDPLAFSSFTNLIRINLKENNLSEILDYTFRSMDLLETLDLSDTGIRKIHSYGFYGLKSLKEIYLNGNKLVELFPFTFADLINLECLFLSDSSVEILHDNLFHRMYNLKYVSLSNNNIKKMNDALFLKASFVEYLDMSNSNMNQIRHLTFYALHKAKTLDLRGNNLSQILNFTFTIQNLESLRDLYLMNSNVEVIQSFAFYRMLNLINLNLEGNRIRFLSEFTFCLLESLVHLNLQYNKIDSIEPNALFKLPKLTLLYLGELRIENRNFNQSSPLFIDLNVRQVSVRFSALRFSFRELNLENRIFLFKHFQSSLEKKSYKYEYYNSYFFRAEDDDFRIRCLSAIYFASKNIRFNVANGEDVDEFLTSCNKMDFVTTKATKIIESYANYFSKCLFTV